MFSSITQFFSSRMQVSVDMTEETLAHSLQVATAALLIEMTRADFEIKPVEQQVMLDALRKAFALDDAELQQLVKLAEAETRQAACLFGFTSLIDKHYSVTDKQRIIELMWQVAAADGELEKYEEHLIRKTTELLHLPHSDFIRAKHRVLAE